MNNETPVSCDLKDILSEIAALKRQCIITYRNEKNEFAKVSGLIVDVYTTSGVDWCKVSNGIVIRLDKIEEFES